MGPRGVASGKLGSHARVALVGVAIGPPMHMIRHRFGGILRAARAGILRRPPTCTAARARDSINHLENPRWLTPRNGIGHRTTGLGPGNGTGREDAPTEIDRE
jgi:hypothetical protein